MDSYKRDRVLKENSKVGGIDWDKWRIRLLTNEIDIYSLVALSLNRTPKRVFKLLSLKDVIEDSRKSIREKIRTFTDVIEKSDKKNFWQSIPQWYGVTLLSPHMEVESAIESIEERLRIIKPHLEKLDTKPVEINGIRTYKCNIASFVALLVYLDLDSKKLYGYAVEYAGSVKSFREVVEGINNPKSCTKQKNKADLTIPTPTDKEEKFYNTLGEIAKGQVDLIKKVIIELGNPKKADIHKECYRQNNTLFTEKFNTFKSHAWDNATKAGRTIKKN